MSVIHVTSENFSQLVNQSEKKVLLDFWASWCGPCRMVAPEVEALAAQREDILVGKIDVDAEGELAAAFGIASIPTLIVMDGGKVAAKAVGYRTKDALEKLVDG